VKEAIGWVDAAVVVEPLGLEPKHPASNARSKREGTRRPRMGAGGPRTQKGCVPALAGLAAQSSARREQAQHDDEQDGIEREHQGDAG